MEVVTPMRPGISGCQVNEVKESSSDSCGILRTLKAWRYWPSGVVSVDVDEFMFSLKKDMVPVLETAAQISPRSACGAKCKSKTAEG